MKAFPFSSIISVVLSSAMAVLPVYGQNPAVQAPATPENDPAALQLHILNAESLQGSVSTGSKQDLTIEVTDSSGVVVPNAAVTCRLPDSGPTGVFGDGSHAAVAYTNPQGRTTIEGIQWGNTPGPVTVRLTAAKGTLHTGILAETILEGPAAVSKAANSALDHVVASQRSQTTGAVPYAAKLTPPTPQPIVSEPAVSIENPATKRLNAPTPQPGHAAAQVALVSPASNATTPSAVDSRFRYSKLGI